MTITSNGPKSVVLTVNTGTPQSSNALSFEVLPLIASVNVATVASPAQTTVTVTGERLDAADAAVNIGGLLLDVGANATPTKLVATVNRVLTTTTPVSVVIDGRESNALPCQLLQINPAAAFAGDTVTLMGNGLSGRNVVVTFGATAVVVGAQPFATQFAVNVPGALAAGAVTVTVTVDGNSTNGVPFTVSG
jgi:hypothetical protein